MATDFTLDDFRKQIDGLGEWGLRDMAPRLPGLSEMIADGTDPKVALKRAAALIDAMTADERRDPALIDDAAKARIAAAVGREPSDVEQFLARFGTLREHMRKLAGMSLWQRIKLIIGLGRPPE